MKHLSIISAAVAVLALSASTAYAEEGSPSFCDSESGCEVITPPLPTVPQMPHGVSSTGLFFTYPNGNVVEGGLNNGQTYIFAGGAGTPYAGQPYSVGDINSSAISFQVQQQPIASVSVSGVQVAYGRADVNMILAYRVILRANDAASANQISQLLNTSGAIARVSGSFKLTADGYGYGDVSAYTGAGLETLDPALSDTFSQSCGHYGLISSASTAGCGTGSFNLAVNFVSGSQFSDGNPLDFVGLVQLGASINVGTAGGGSFTPTPGTAMAFIDPTITLASGIKGTLILGDGGNVSNVTSVPEPESWAMSLAGLGVLALALKRRRA